MWEVSLSHIPIEIHILILPVSAKICYPHEVYSSKFLSQFLMSLFGPCTHVQMTIDYMSGVNSKFMERYGFSSPTVWPYTCILLMFTSMYKDVEKVFLLL